MKMERQFYWPGQTGDVFDDESVQMMLMNVPVKISAESMPDEESGPFPKMQQKLLESLTTPQWIRFCEVVGGFMEYDWHNKGQFEIKRIFLHYKNNMLVVGIGKVGDSQIRDHVNINFLGVVQMAKE